MTGAPEALLVGRRLGVYRIDALIGAGGMGRVYRARDTRLGRDVAIKVLAGEVAAEPDRLQRFEREARVLASLDHPNIGAIYGLAESEGVLGLVLELVEGESLADRVACGPIPQDEALRFARQIAGALDAAHELGIVHRDLKPANITITADGTVKVLDFGLAATRAGSAAAAGSDLMSTTTALATEPGVIMGTPSYMSPEQARGEAVDRRADVWALGCVLYEMLCGRLAFPGNTASDSIAAVLAREPNLTALPPNTPREVRRLIARCLEKDPRRRMRDMGDICLDIDELLSGGAMLDRVVPRRSTGLLAWGVAGLLVVVVAAMAGSGWIHPAVSPADPEPRLARAVRLTGDSERAFGAAVSPDGKWVAYYSNRRGPTDLWVTFLETGARLNLTEKLNLELPARAGIGGLAISPDGTQIAFVVRTDPAQVQYDTWVIPGPIGGVPHKLIQVAQGAQWSPDGRRLCYIIPGSSRGDALAIAQADGTSPRVVAGPEGGRHLHWPAWSRDGTHVYFIYTFDTWNGEPSEIWRVAAEGGPVEPVVRSARRAVYPVPLPAGDLVYAGNPDGLELGLWWQPASSSIPRPLTTGVGEHTEPRLSANGRKLVATLVDMRRSLTLLSLRGRVAEERPLTDGSGGDLDPSASPHGDRIVFDSARSGHRNLWVAGPGLQDAAPLTAEAFIDERPSFSPDGQQIAFVSDRSGRRAIWVMNAEGGAPKRLGDVDVLDALTWSRDGRRVFFARPGGDAPTLASLSVQDGTVEPFATPAGAVAPAWSPTSDVLAYLEPVTVPGRGPSSSPTSRLWLRFADSHGRPLYRHLPEQSFTNGQLGWAPDGRRLAALTIPANGPASVWIVEPEGAVPYRKLLDLGVTAWPRGVTWTPDGSSIIIGKEEPRRSIVLFDVNR